MPRRSSKTLILDLAEELFAQEGIDVVSLRQINEALGLSSAAVHYHFKNKEDLLTAVLERRLRPESERDKVLNQLVTGELELTTEHLVQALVSPLAAIFIQDLERGDFYLQILSEIYSDKSQRYHAYLPSAFISPLPKFQRLLEQLLPCNQAQHLPELRRRYAFGVTTMIEGMANYQLIEESGLRQLSDQEQQEHKQQYIKSLERFIQQGLNIN